MAGEPDVVDLHLAATTEAFGVAGVKLMPAKKMKMKRPKSLHFCMMRFNGLEITATHIAKEYDIIILALFATACDGIAELFV